MSGQGEHQTIQPSASNASLTPRKPQVNCNSNLTLTGIGSFRGIIMQRLGILARVITAVWIGLLAAGSTFAADTNLATPEGAVASYIEGVARQDLTAVLAAASVDDMSKGFDFVAHVDRLRVLMPSTPAPTGDPLFVEINRAGFAAQIARQVQFLTYGLMTTKEIIDGQNVQMDATGATDFANVVRATRLASLALVKVGIPSPKTLNSERHQLNMAKLAGIYGADAMTERVALLSFEGLQFVIGFSLLRYGDNWTIMSQSSPIANLGGLGIPKRTTSEAFEQLTK